YTQTWAGNGAILRSADQGKTWQRTDMPFKMGGNEDGRSIGERLAIDPNKNSILYFGSRHNGLWKSSDYGATWGKVSSFPVTGRTNGIGIGFVLFDPYKSTLNHPASTVYVGVAAAGTNLYRSNDEGATWQAVQGQPLGFIPHHGLLDAGGTLYLTYGNNPGPNGVSNGAVWKYDTDKALWINITPLPPGAQKVGNFGYAGLTVDAAHPGTLMVSTMDWWSHGDEIFRSTDGGTHWTPISSHAQRDSSISPFLNWGRPTVALGHWIGDVEIDPFNSDHVLYVTGATIWGSDDATAGDENQTTHWTVRAEGLEETAVLDLISPPDGAHLISGLGDIGGFRHDDLTVSPRSGMFTNPMFNNTTSLDFAENNPMFMARVGSAGNGIRRGAYSMDGGTTWTPFENEPTGSRGSGSIAVSADAKTLLWSPQGSAPFYSRDNGKTWSVCNGLQNGSHPISDRVNPNTFYVLDGNARKLYVSTDGGANFTMKAAELPTGSNKLRAMPGREGDLWLTAGKSGLHHTLDGGANFVKIANVQEAYALGFGKAAPGQPQAALYLTGKLHNVSGVFRSDDVGVTWVRINDDQHQYGWIGQVVTGDPRVYGRVYLATNGRGILYADPLPGNQSG
ncbi:MAG: xyloglucanase, partial [Abitibacteriaceae bacterium]|nr:xyloglucanase [Abditibacteriaceae bacterium]